MHLHSMICKKLPDYSKFKILTLTTDTFTHKNLVEAHMSAMPAMISPCNMTSTSASRVFALVAGLKNTTSTSC